MWLIVTIVVFFIARRLAVKYKNPLLNPLLVTVAALIIILMLLHISFPVYYADTKIVSYLLQPAVVALAYPLYEQLPQIRKNWRILAFACVLGSIMSMLSGMLIALALGSDIKLIASILSKSVTTPIAMEVSRHLGGEPSIAAVLVIMVGLFGSIIGYPVYRLIGITHPVARGITMGAVSHALGTAAAAEKAPEDAAYSSLALVMCGIITSILAPLFFAIALWIAK